jgi:glycosyltransferase involved in cell wall biosynthesis
MAPSVTIRRAKPVLAYLVTEDWYFLSHRLPMAREAQRAGYDVHVITHVNEGAAAIEAEGFRLHSVVWRRGSLNPVDFISNIRAVRRHYKAINPDLVHHVALQPTVVGSLAAAGMRCTRLNAIAGLGFAFTSSTLKARLVRPILSAFLRYVLGHPRAAVLVQNPDDRKVAESLGIAADGIFVIPGSGVETDRLMPLPEPPGPVTVAFVGRLLDDKGVRSLIEAHDILGRRGQPVRLLIAGEPDPANPVSIPPQEIAEWGRRLRPSHRGDRRAGLPRDRAPGPQRAVGAARRRGNARRCHRPPGTRRPIAGPLWRRRPAAGGDPVLGH